MKTKPSDMRCVILAAGRSTRLRSLTNGRPKCLLTVGKITILERMVRNVLQTGISDICVVTGYEAGQIRDFLSAKFPRRRFTFVHNRSFASTNNAYSLFLARDFCLAPLHEIWAHLKQSEQMRRVLLVLDSDIVFTSELLLHIFERNKSDCLAARVRGFHDEEEIKVQIDGTVNVTKIGKDIPLARTFGESVGIETFSIVTAQKLFKVLEQRMRRPSGRMEFYEATFQKMIDTGTRIRAVDISQFPAVEIDTPDDLDHARRVIAPKLERQ